MINYTFTELLKYITKSKTKYFILGIMIFVQSIFPVLLSGQIKQGLDIILYNSSGSLLSVFTTLMALITVYSACVFLKRPLQETLSVNSGYSLLELIYGKIYRLPQKSWDSIPSGDIFTLMESDTLIVREHLSKYLLPLIIEISGIAFGYATVFNYSARLFIISLTGAIPLLLLIRLYSKKIGKNTVILQENTGKLNAFFDEDFHNMDMTRIYNSEDYTNDLHDRYYNERSSASVKNKALSGGLSGLSLFFVILPNAFIIMLGVFDIKNGTLTFGELSAITTILEGTILWPLTRIPGTLSEISKQMASFKRCIDFLNIPEENVLKNESVISEEKEKFGTLSMEKVNFSYKDRKVIHDLSLKFNTGEITLITGPGGSGKSTLVKLLTGLYKPDSGAITIDNGIERISVGFKDISYVPQNEFCIEGLTLADNIKMETGQGNMENAAALSKVDEFSDELEQKLSTVVDESRGFSKGQLQRVAIARAIYKDSPFIVLDEPFSALDEKNIDYLKKTLRNLAADKGIIIISHRHTEPGFADKTYSIKDGNVYHEA